MSKRRIRSEDSNRFGSKRSRILESDEENDVHVENNQVDDGIQSSDSDDDDNCSQNPGFISEQNVSYVFLIYFPYSLWNEMFLVFFI